MFSRKIETHKLLDRVIGQPMFRTLPCFCLYSNKLEHFGGAERFKRDSSCYCHCKLLVFVNVVREINSTTLFV